MAKNPFRTTVGANDPIFQKAMMQKRFGKNFDDQQWKNVISGMGADTAQAGFEFADLFSAGAPNIAGLDPQEVAKRFAGQLQGHRQMLPGQQLDMSKLSADIDLTDLLGANTTNNPLHSRNVSLQNLLGAGTDFSRAVQSQLTPMMASRLGGSNLSEGATAQAFIDAIKRDPNAGDPTATFSSLEGAPSLAYSNLQAHAAADPFSRNVLERIRNFTNTYDPSAPDRPMGQEQQRFDAAVAEGVAADQAETARIESGGYDDSALRTQLSEQQNLIKQLSDRLNQPSRDTQAVQAGQTQTQAMLGQLLGREQLGSAQLQELLAQSQQGRVTEDAISQIMQNQLTQADIRGQVGQAVQSEFGDVFTQAMIDKQSAEQQRFDTLMESLSARQQQEEQLSREQFARQDAIREQQEAAVGETIREAERAGQSAYENVRGLPMYQADFSATDPLRQSIQDAITSRLGGTELDAMATERYAQLDEDAARQRADLTERLSRLGLLRQGGDTADVLGEFEGQVVRGRQGIASDMQQMQQDLITQGITEGTDFRGQEADTELRRIDQQAQQTQSARDLDLRRHVLQQDVADRVLSRGLTRLGPTERERFENQLRSQQQAEYLNRSELAQRKELAESELEQRQTEFGSQQELAERQLTQQAQQASADRGLRRYEIGQERAEAQLNRSMERDFAEIDRQLREGEIDSREAEAQKNRKFEQNQNFFDRQLQQNLSDQQNQFSLDMQQGNLDFQSTEANLDRQQQLSVMRNENEQRLAERNLQETEATLDRLHAASENIASRVFQREMTTQEHAQQQAERNLRESEANLNRLQQTSERTSAEGFQREMTSQEHAQRQSDRNLQELLETNRNDLTREQNRLDRENQLELSLQGRNFQRDQAELDRSLQQTESAFQRGMITAEAALDRTFESTKASQDRQHTNAQNELQRNFQIAMLENEQSFNREQNEYLRQERENSQNFQAAEALEQRDFLTRQATADRQQQLLLERNRLNQERNEALEQRSFLSDQSNADRQQALVLMREEHSLADQLMDREHSFARELQSQEDIQRQSDRDHQVNLQNLVEGRITSEAALDREHQLTAQDDQQEWLALESQTAFDRDKTLFEEEMNQRTADRQENIRQFNQNQINVDTELGIQKQAAADQTAQFKRIHDIQEAQFGRHQNFIEDDARQNRMLQKQMNRDQASFEREQWEESKLQFGRQANFQEEEARLQREFQNQQFEEQQNQFSRQQDFVEGQAAQDDLYRAIGTMLAAQESGMDLGIGATGAAPGGLNALLRGELGKALDMDLANWGPAVEGNIEGQRQAQERIRRIQEQNRANDPIQTGIRQIRKLKFW